MRLQFPDATRAALLDLARRERREPARQAEYLVIAELHRRGFVTADGLERLDAPADVRQLVPAR